MTTYREACGTRWGLSMHAADNEDPCGTCLEADDLARARHEGRQPVPGRPSQDDDMRELIGILARLLSDHDNAIQRKRRAA